MLSMMITTYLTAPGVTLNSEYSAKCDFFRCTQAACEADRVIFALARHAGDCGHAAK